jgi:hypothetical protein
VTGPLNSQPTRASEYRHIGVRSLEIPFVDIASSEIPIGRTPIAREKSTLTHVGVRGIVRHKTRDHRIREIAKFRFPDH